MIGIKVYDTVKFDIGQDKKGNPVARNIHLQDEGGNWQALPETQ